jgi:hypothetical protein
MPIQQHQNITASKQTVLIQITSDDNKTVTKKLFFKL